MIARRLLRLAEETTKPNAERLREYAEAGLDSLKQQLFSEAPIYPDLEIVKLADSLSMLMEIEGADDPLVQKILAGKSPRERAAELVAGSKLADVRLRKQLADGGAAAIAKSDDPMIELARLVDGPAARSAAFTKSRSTSRSVRPTARSPRLGFAIYGDTRLSRCDVHAPPGLRQGGRLSGSRAQKLPPWTTIGGAYEHSADARRQGSLRAARKLASSTRRISICRRRSTSSARPTSSAAIRAAR